MICEICQTRNPTGFCVTCEKALCEECSNQCEECGKMVCPACVATTRSGKMLCSNCMEERRAKKAESKVKAKAGTAPAEGEVPEEEEFPEPVRRVQVRPWVASLLIGGIGILLSLFFYATGGAVHWTVLFLVVLGVIWALVGIVGPSEQKAQAIAGLVLNLVPIILALSLGIEAPWIDTEKEAAQKQAQELTPEQKFQQRRQERQNVLRRLKPEQ
jgi:hypothetical protein